MKRKRGTGDNGAALAYAARCAVHDYRRTVPAHFHDRLTDALVDLYLTEGVPGEMNALARVVIARCRSRVARWGRRRG